ncbi:hypothetical protein quinque_011767 [Culex quinquefasciatus]
MFFTQASLVLTAIWLLTDSPVAVSSIDITFQEHIRDAQKKYLLVNDKKSFFGAWQDCTSLGLKLATVTSKADADELATAIGSYNPEYKQQCRPLIFQNFMKGEPNNQDGKEDCVSIGQYPDYKWNDDECEKLKHYICEA